MPAGATPALVRVHGLGPCTFPAKGRNHGRAKAKLSPGVRGGRPATGADASPERSESQKAPRPPLVLETGGRRSFVPSPPSTRCSRVRAPRPPLNQGPISFEGRSPPLG